MNEVECQTWEDKVITDQSVHLITKARCVRCGHIVVSLGGGSSAILSCERALQSQCPRGEKNSYALKAV